MATHNSVPVTFDGVEYPSKRALERAKDIPIHRIQKLIKKYGHVLTSEYLEANTFECGESSRKIIICDGVEYPSRKRLAQAFGIPFNTFSSRLQLGWTVEQAVGLEPRPKKKSRYYKFIKQRFPKTKKYLIVDDRKIPISTVAERLGCDYQTIYHRIKAGWSDRDVVLTPPGERKMSLRKADYESKVKRA